MNAVSNPADRVTVKQLRELKAALQAARDVAERIAGCGTVTSEYRASKVLSKLDNEMADVLCDIQILEE